MITFLFRFPSAKLQEAICSCSNELRWVSGMFYWVKYVQSYDKNGWNYIEEIEKLSTEIAKTGKINRTSIISIDCILKTGSVDCDSGEDTTDRLYEILPLISSVNITNTTASPTSDPPTRKFHVSAHYWFLFVVSHESLTNRCFHESLTNPTRSQPFCLPHIIVTHLYLCAQRLSKSSFLPFK